MRSLRAYWQAAPGRARFTLLCAAVYAVVYVASFAGFTVLDTWGSWLTLPVLGILGVELTEYRRERRRSQRADLAEWRAVSDAFYTLAAQPGPPALPGALRVAIALSIVALAAGWIELLIRGDAAAGPVAGDALAGPATRILAAMAVIFAVDATRHAIRTDWPVTQARMRTAAPAA